MPARAAEFSRLALRPAPAALTGRAQGRRATRAGEACCTVCVTTLHLCVQCRPGPPGIPVAEEAEKGRLYGLRRGWHPLCFSRTRRHGGIVHLSSATADGPEEEETMSKITSITAVLAIAVALAMPAHAQSNALTSYENFLAQHQAAAQALSANPSL